MKRTAVVLLTAVLVVLAGCTGGVPGDAPGTGSDSATTTQAATGGDGAAGAGDAGRVSFYVSDERNDIEDFEHLNVTVSRVAFHYAGNASASDDGSGEWREYDMGGQTVDLTELQGENASQVADFEVPNGTYTGVRLYVSDVDGTLEGGESADVKLPSETLKITETFTVGNGEQVDFVFDITVHEAGNSGKYVLKPVVSESGTDVPFRTVDDGERGLRAHFTGDVRAGTDATVKVVGASGPVEGATVVVNGEQVGTTGAKGRVTFAVPDDAEEVEVEIERGDAEAELKALFGAGADDDDEREDGDDEREDGDEAGDDDEGNDDAGEVGSLAASFVGSVAANGDVTVKVTRGGEPVEGAEVVVGGEVVAETDADGTATFAVTEVGEDLAVGDELEVEVVAGDDSVEIEQALSAAAGASASG